MREVSVRLERRFDAPPEALWELLADPRVTARFQSKARLQSTTGEPGSVGFRYVLAAVRGGRADTVEVIDADRPRLLLERVTSDLLAGSAPGEVVHPSGQRTELVPDGDGTLLRWQLSTPAPRWAAPYLRWSTRRAVGAIFDGVAAELSSR